MNLIPSVLSAAKLSDALAAAGQPVADEIAQKVVDALAKDEQLALDAGAKIIDHIIDRVKAEIIPAVGAEIEARLSGLTVTNQTTISKKGAS